MKYSKFIIKNYKGIKEVTIDLDKQPISKVLTLVGLNESGKTSILEAIDLLQNDISEKDNHTLIPKEKKLNFNDVIIIEAHLNLDLKDNATIKNFSKTLGFKEIDDINTVTITRKKVFKDSEFIKEKSTRLWAINIKGKKKNQRKVAAVYNSEDRKQIIDFINKNLLPPIIYYPNFLFDFPERIFLEESSGESEEQQTYREVISDILDSIGGGLNIENHIVARMKSVKDESKEALASTINKMSSKVTKTVFNAWEALFKSKGKEILIKSGIEEIEKSCFLEVRLKEGSNEYHITERSLGFKWFFTFLLFTEFRKVRSTDEGEILFLLDEPASNLHSTAQKKLLNTFEKLVDNCKLIYTTHSHHLINPDWLSGAYIIRNKNLNYEDEINYESELTDIEAIPYRQFVSNHPDQSSYFQPILDALDFQPGLLEEIPNIIITEGKTDYYTYRYVSEIILKNKFETLKFYPGTGADRNDQVIALYLAWNRNFKIILDGDGGGRKAKERYVKNFGEIIKSNIISLNEIDKSFENKTIETLFNESERLLILKEFDTGISKFDKSKFATAVQILFIDKKVMKLSRETLKNFNKIFSALT